MRRFTSDEIRDRLIDTTDNRDFLNIDKFITIIYASISNTYIINVSDLSDEDELDLVNSFIYNMTFGTNYSREIIKKFGNTYIVY